jgi:hypothetical protein
MIRARCADTLDSWLAQAEAAGIVEFKRFAQSLRSDYRAVQTALQCSWSNGQTEGQAGARWYREGGKGKTLWCPQSGQLVAQIGVSLASAKPMGYGR